jgi:tetratricopeptide (TPR) repeat protein
MNDGEFILAYNIFSNIIEKEPGWAEGWNKRATVLYLMNKYHSSLNDIEEVLLLEPRHFGALSGQALVYIKLGEYEKAIKSYKAAKKIYPIIDSANKMIPQLEELIKNQAI